jgi:glutamate formiminotransferase/formiminotetrahydrofolate cyclodeaminase
MHDRLSELSVRDLLGRLSTSAPVPGGGSAAAVAGAFGAALVHMVVELTVGRPSAAGQEDTLGAIRAEASRLRDALVDLAEADALAYERVVVARRLPKDTDAERAERQSRIAAATRDATEAPLATARAAGAVLALAEQLAPIGNANAISDVGVGGMLAATALRGAAMNVAINLPSLSPDDPLGAAAGAEIDRLLAELDGRERALRQAVQGRMG